MSELIKECDRVENTIYFLALNEAQQAEIRALSTESEKCERLAVMLAKLDA